jgi:hypothetical protein
VFTPTLPAHTRTVTGRSTRRSKDLGTGARAPPIGSTDHSSRDSIHRPLIASSVTISGVEGRRSMKVLRTLTASAALVLMAACTTSPSARTPTSGLNAERTFTLGETMRPCSSGGYQAACGYLPSARTGLTPPAA